MNRTEFPFSERARSALAAAGWTPERDIDSAPAEAALAAQGQVVSPAVRAFLRRYGQLALEFRSPRIPQYAGGFGFDTPRSAKGSRRLAEVFGAIVVAPLCAVGEQGRALLFIDPAGAMYLGYDDTLLVAGASPEEAIEALCAEAWLESAPGSTGPGDQRSKDASPRDWYDLMIAPVPGESAEQRLRNKLVDEWVVLRRLYDTVGGDPEKIVDGVDLERSLARSDAMKTARARAAWRGLVDHGLLTLRWKSDDVKLSPAGLEAVRRAIARSPNEAEHFSADIIEEATRRLEADRT